MKTTIFTLALLMIMPILCPAQGKTKTANDRFKPVELSVSYGLIGYGLPAQVNGQLYMLNSVGQTGLATSSSHSSIYQLNGSLYISRSIDVGVMYSQNNFSYQCVNVKDNSTFAGYLAKPAKRFGVSSRYHYHIKKWEANAGLSVADLSSPSVYGLSKTKLANGYSYSGIIGGKYQLTKSVAATLQLQVIRDNYTWTHFGTTLITIVDYSMMAGISLRF